MEFTIESCVRGHRFSPKNFVHRRRKVGLSVNTGKVIQTTVEGWVDEIEHVQLSLISPPHAAYVAYTHGLSHKRKFLLWTIPSIGYLLTPLETAIRHSLIPSITGKRDLNDHMRRIMALPTRLGGLGLDNPQSESESEYSASCNVCLPITDLIIQQSGQDSAS